MEDSDVKATFIIVVGIVLSLSVFAGCTVATTADRAELVSTCVQHGNNPSECASAAKGAL